MVKNLLQSSDFSITQTDIIQPLVSLQKQPAILKIGLNMFHAPPLVLC